MAFAIELFFDRGGENRIQTLWQKLADSGVSSFLPNMWVRPHLSLAVFDEADPGRLKGPLQDFAAHNRPLTVRFCAAGAFPGDPTVIFVQPVVSFELLEMHQRLHQIISQNGIESHLLYQPGQWLPHCAVAPDAPPKLVGRAVEIVHSAFPLGTTRCIDLGLIEYQPVRELFRFRLRGEQP